MDNLRDPKGVHFHGVSLEEILSEHEEWVKQFLPNASNEHHRAIFQDLDLSYINFSNRNLQHIQFHNCNLSYSNFDGAALRNATLRNSEAIKTSFNQTDLHHADLRHSSFIESYCLETNFEFALLFDVNFTNSNLKYANFYNAGIEKANFSNVEMNFATTFLGTQCPEEGSFIAFKSCGDYLVKLKVSENAKRSSATTYKCRCDSAEVLSIKDIYGNSISSIHSNFDKNFIYEIGKTVKIDNFDDDWRIECSNGIHFFMSKIHAETWK